MKSQIERLALMKTYKRIILTILVIFAAILFTSSGSEVIAQNPSTERVSVSTGGIQSNELSGGPSISADGRFIVFISNANNLVPNDTNNSGDVFVYDRQTNETTRVSVATDGTEQNSNLFNYDSYQISDDGRLVVFHSSANNLVPGDNNGKQDIFVHDRETSETTIVSVSSSGVYGNSVSSFPSISADGRFVAFESGSDNLVTGPLNGYLDIFVRDRQTGVTTQVSINSEGIPADFPSSSPSISADGQIVAFVSSARNLDPRDTNSTRHAFVHNRQTGETKVVSIATNGTLADSLVSDPKISGNGRFIAFQTRSSNLVPSDTNGNIDVFIHDLQTEQTTRVSVASDGSQGISDSYLNSISYDGRYVAFQTYNDFGGITSSFSQVFVHDRQTGETIPVSYAYNGVLANGDSGSGVLSADGRFVAFDSYATNLVPGDTNGFKDVFVVKLSMGNSVDVTAPAGITNLAATIGSASGTVDLTWTAPGDDGTIGAATSYIVRYWDYPIGTELGWAASTDVDGEPTPKAMGTTESMTISGLTPGKTYYFMVRAEDEAGNRSDLGNSPSAVAADVIGSINLTISLYKVADTAAARAPYEHILEFFADAVYEMSNGAHKIGIVTIYQGGASSDTANIHWKAEEWPCADVAGYTNSGQIFMGDVFPFPNNSFNALAESNWRSAGYTLAHELGHYYYGLYDEYKAASTDDDNNSIFPHSDDKPVTNSVMNNHWSAVSGNFNWLNFSIAKNNTKRTAQHRMYAASGWETLARPVSEDPRDGYRSAKPIRVYYDELANVAPESDQNASLQLPDGQSEARNQLNITWLDGSGSPQDYIADVRSTFGEILEYPRTVVLVAKVSKDYPIAKAGLTASAQAPDDTVTPLTLKDDGNAPDIIANDGLFSGWMPYNQGGSYIINVAFNNSGNVAEETRISYAHATGPNGETYQDIPQPISENFNIVATATITITDFKTDDHGDTAQTATNLLPTNVDVPGRIDRSGDIDMFKVIPSETGQLIVRVSGLAFDMQPKIRILSADGQTVVDEFNFTPQGNEYFFTPVNTQASQAFYIVISHSNQNAVAGSYDVSVGSPLTGNQESGSSVYLPIILK